MVSQAFFQGRTRECMLMMYSDDDDDDNGDNGDETVLVYLNLNLAVKCTTTCLALLCYVAVQPR